MNTTIRDNTNATPTGTAEMDLAQTPNFSFTSAANTGYGIVDFSLSIYADPNVTYSSSANVSVYLYADGRMSDGNPRVGQYLITLGRIGVSALATGTHTYHLPSVAGYILTPSTRYWISLYVDSGPKTPNFSLSNVTTGTGITGEYFYPSSGTNARADPSDTPVAAIVEDQTTCYAPGTLIATSKGEVPIERLRPSDLLVCAITGGFVPLRWVGTQRRAVGGPGQQPIRIMAHAFGPGRPHTDLVVSPDHGLLLDGTLVQAFALVNDVTVRRESVRTIRYHHLETRHHGAVFANGLPAETWLDVGNRHLFDNATVIDLAPPPVDLANVPGQCAPRVSSGPIVLALRRALHAGAATLGYGATMDCGVQLMADGEPARPVAHGSDSLHFELPRAARHPVLRSRRTWPGDVGADDGRCLGVAIAGLEIDGEPVGLEMLAGRSGWWQQEREGRREWCWTNGDGVLPPIERKVTIHLAQCGARYLTPLTDRASLAA